MGNIVGKVEGRIRNAILTEIDNIVTPWIELAELAVRLINASFGGDASSVMGNSERGERIGSSAFFENVSERNNTFHELSANDETRRNVPEEVSELLASRTQLIGNHALITI